MRTRRLALRRETLAELTADDLSRVAGAAPDETGLSCPVGECLERDLSDDLSCHKSCGPAGCWSYYLC